MKYLHPDLRFIKKKSDLLKITTPPHHTHRFEFVFLLTHPHTHTHTTCTTQPHEVNYAFPAAFVVLCPLPFFRESLLFLILRLEVHVDPLFKASTGGTTEEATGMMTLDDSESRRNPASIEAETMQPNTGEVGAEYEGEERVSFAGGDSGT
jgi:hypothetical protein